jgi:hypothetical protein
MEIPSDVDPDDPDSEGENSDQADQTEVTMHGVTSYVTRQRELTAVRTNLRGVIAREEPTTTHDVELSAPVVIRRFPRLQYKRERLRLRRRDPGAEELAAETSSMLVDEETSRIQQEAADREARLERARMAAEEARREAALAERQEATERLWREMRDTAQVEQQQLQARLELERTMQRQSEEEERCRRAAEEETKRRHAADEEDRRRLELEAEHAATDSPEVDWNESERNAFDDMTAAAAAAYEDAAANLAKADGRFSCLT